MKPDERTRQERKVDEALEETFPASDTPSFVGAGADSKKNPDDKRPDADEDPVRRRFR